MQPVRNLGRVNPTAIADKTQNFLNKNQDNIINLRRYGIKKHLTMQNSSNIFVTYPRKQDLEFTPNKNVFMNASKCAKSIYIHIPFCAAICSYCSFARTATHSDNSSIRTYLELLDQEIYLVKDSLSTKHIKASSIFIGGGTPTLLNSKDLTFLFEIINRHFGYNEQTEFTLEGSPDTITYEKLSIAKNYGANRLSMGVETFNHDILQQIRRQHSIENITNAIESSKKLNFNSTNIDLIRGLPGYNLNMIEQDVEQFLKLNIESLTSYQYIVKPKSIDHKLYKSKDPENNRLFEHLYFINLMQQNNFKQQQPLIDWFTQGSSYHFKHNTEKWSNNHELLAFGQGAYGYINSTQYINFEARKAYATSIINKQIPIAKATTLSADETKLRNIIFGLKSSIPSHSINDVNLDVDYKYKLKHKLAILQQHGAIINDGNQIYLSQLGALFADWIMVFMHSNAKILI